MLYLPTEHSSMCAPKLSTAHEKPFLVSELPAEESESVKIRRIFGMSGYLNSQTSAGYRAT